MEEKPQDQSKKDNGARSLRKALNEDERRRLKLLFAKLFGSQESFKEGIHAYQEKVKDKHHGWSIPTWRNVWAHLTSAEGRGWIEPQFKIDLLRSYVQQVASDEGREEEGRLALELVSKLNDLSALKEKLLHLILCTGDGEVITPTRTFTVRSGEMVGRAIESDNEHLAWKGAPGVKAIAPVSAGRQFHREFAIFNHTDQGWTITYLKGKVVPLLVDKEAMQPGRTRMVGNDNVLTFGRNWHYRIQDDDCVEYHGW